MWTGLAFALGLGLFFSIFGLRFCTSNSSSLLRFVGFVIWSNSSRICALRPLFKLKNEAVFELPATIFARIPRRMPFVQFLVAFRSCSRHALKHRPKAHNQRKTTMDERSHRVTPFVQSARPQPLLTGPEKAEGEQRPCWRPAGLAEEGS